MLQLTGELSFELEQATDVRGYWLRRMVPNEHTSQAKGSKQEPPERDQLLLSKTGSYFCVPHSTTV